MFRLQITIKSITILMVEIGIIFEGVSVADEFPSRICVSPIKGNEIMESKTTKNLRDVIHGEHTHRTDFPYMAIVYRLIDGNISDAYCAAVILTKKWVASSSICGAQTERPFDITIIAGPTRMGPNKNLGYIVRKVDETFQHRSIGMSFYKVTKPFKFNEYIAPVNFPRKNYKVKSHDICITLGWDQVFDEEEQLCLMKHAVSIVNPDKCMDSAEKYDPLHILHSDEICVATTSKQNPCPQDDGAPLICGEEFVGILAKQIRVCPSTTVKYKEIASSLTTIYHILTN